MEISLVTKCTTKVYAKCVLYAYLLLICSDLLEIKTYIIELT